MFRIICDLSVEQIFPHKITNRPFDGKILIKKSQDKRIFLNFRSRSTDSFLTNISLFQLHMKNFCYFQSQRNARNHVRIIEISVKNPDGETKNWRRVKFSRSPKVGPIFLEFEKQTNKKCWNLRS